MNAASTDELLVACQVLFGREFELSFLGHLQESGLRAAWRIKALQTHPDRTLDSAAKHRHTALFIEARKAYHVLQDYLGRRNTRREPPPSRGSHPAAARSAQQRPPGRQRTAPPRRGDHRASPFYPRRRLRLGEYLYHSRVIPFSALIEALVWQRRQRDRFCEVGRRWGYLSEADMKLLLSLRRPHEQVGATAQRLRMLSAFQVRTVLSFQQSRQQPIGTYFIQRGLLTPATLCHLLQRFEQHNTGYSKG